MMIIDDDLLLYQYGDGLGFSERDNIAKALAADAMLVERMHRLIAELDAVTAPCVPAPDAMQQRWRAALANAANASAKNSTQPTQKSHWKTNFAFAATALLSLAVGVTFWQKHESSGTNSSSAVAIVKSPNFPVDSERFERSLTRYLSDAEQQLTSLKQLRTNERGPLLERVLMQNRMYAIAADRANEPRYARALRGFAPVIETIRGEDKDASELEAGVAQLKFELKVMQGRLSATSNSSKKADLAAPI